MKKFTIAAAAAGVGLLSASMFVGTAHADPNPGPPSDIRPLNLVGSDTTDGLMQNISEAITLGGSKPLANWIATGTPTISPNALAACQNINRPNGSSAGRNALLAEITRVDALPGSANMLDDGCFQAARSSSDYSTGSYAYNLTLIPVASDPLVYSVNSNSVLPKSLSLAEVQSIYNCIDPTLDVLVPQIGSGTRQSWNSFMGITDAQIASTLSCISDVDLSGNQVQEHDGRNLISPVSITPYGVAKYISQKASVIPDVTAIASLGTIDGEVPFIANGAVPTTREVFNTIPTSKINTTPWKEVFVGPTSLVCASTAQITEQNFGINPNCGSTAKTTVGGVAAP